MAAFAGYDLGLIEEMTTAPLETARQVNSYPGVNGLELLLHGSRGLKTSVRGVLGGVDVVDLGLILQTLGGLAYNSTVDTLLDANGTLWPSVLADSFRPVGRRYVLPGGGVAQRYEMEFLHPGP